MLKAPRRLGYYDHDRFVAILGEHSSRWALRTTVAHEHAHHFLDCASAHGQLLRRVSRDIRAGREADRNLGLLKFLSDICTRVHEGYATYYGSRPLSDFESMILPKEYQIFYSDMASLVDPVFSRTVPALCFAEAIARTCMTSYQLDRCHKAGDYSYDFIFSQLKKDEYPDQRLETLRSRAHLIARDNVIDKFNDLYRDEQFAPYRLLLDCDSEEQMRTIAGFGCGISSNEGTNFRVMLMHTLFDLVTPLFPDIEDEFSSFRFLVNFAVGDESARAIENQWSPFQISEVRTLQRIIQTLQQTVKVYDADVPTIIRPLSSKSLPFQISTIRQKLGIAYGYESISLNHQYEYFLADNPDGLVTFFAVPPSSADPSFGDCLTIVEEETYEAIRLLQLRRYPDVGDFRFVHVNDNAGDFIRRRASSSKIRATTVQIRYSGGPLKDVQGLEMAIYQVEGEEPLFFHLTNEWMSNALAELIALIGDATRAQMDYSLVDRHIAAIQNLINHPVMTFYVLGGRPDIGNFG